jgi:hypothetical protein
MWLLQEPKFQRNILPPPSMTRIGELGTLAVTSEVQLLVTANVPGSPNLVNLMMEVIHSSETSLLTRAKQCDIPQDGILLYQPNVYLYTYIYIYIYYYLGTTVTNQNLIQEEIKRRLNSGNACYHSVQNLLSSPAVKKCEG